MIEVMGSVSVVLLGVDAACDLVMQLLYQHVRELSLIAHCAQAASNYASQYLGLHSPDNGAQCKYRAIASIWYAFRNFNWIWFGNTDAAAACVRVAVFFRIALDKSGVTDDMFLLLRPVINDGFACGLFRFPFCNYQTRALCAFLFLLGTSLAFSGETATARNHGIASTGSGVNHGFSAPFNRLRLGYPASRRDSFFEGSGHCFGSCGCVPFA
jgi:hypothetical protein